jgi:hypothetical protein
MLPKHRIFLIIFGFIIFFAASYVLFTKLSFANTTCNPDDDWQWPEFRIVTPEHCDEVSGTQQIKVSVEDPVVDHIDLRLFAPGSGTGPDGCYTIATGLRPINATPPYIFKKDWDSTKVVDHDEYWIDAIGFDASDTEIRWTGIRISTSNGKTGQLCQTPDAPPSNGDGDPKKQTSTQTDQSSTTQTQTSESTQDSEKKTKKKAKTGDVETLLQFSGKAKPNTLVTLYIFSNPVIAAVESDAQGNWSYEREKSLDSGKHSAFATIYDEGVTRRSNVTEFYIAKSANTGRSLVLAKSTTQRFYPYAYVLGTAIIVAIVVVSLYRIYRKRRQTSI